MVRVCKTGKPETRRTVFVPLQTRGCSWLSIDMVADGPFTNHLVGPRITIGGLRGIGKPSAWSIRLGGEPSLFSMAWRHQVH